MKKLVAIAAGLLPTLCSLAQNQAFELPVYFGQFYNDPQVNTVVTHVPALVDFRLGHRRNTNNFGGINTSFFNVVYNRAADRSGHHAFGAFVVTDKEGFLIRRNRAYLSYSRHLQLNETYYLAGGASAGIYTFGVKSNPVTGGFSDAAFDGSFGVGLYSESTRVGFSLNQFTNSRIQPLQQEIYLTRHVNLTAGHTFDLNESFSLEPLLWTRYSKKTYLPTTGLFVAGCLQLIVKDVVMAGMNVETHNGVYFLMGIKHLDLGETELNIDFSYFAPNRKNFRSNVQRFEVTVHYAIQPD